MESQAHLGIDLVIRFTGLIFHFLVIIEIFLVSASL